MEAFRPNDSFARRKRQVASWPLQVAGALLSKRRAAGIDLWMPRGNSPVVGIRELPAERSSGVFRRSSHTRAESWCYRVDRHRGRRLKCTHRPRGRCHPLAPQACPAIEAFHTRSEYHGHRGRTPHERRSRRVRLLCINASNTSSYRPAAVQFLWPHAHS